MAGLRLGALATAKSTYNERQVPYNSKLNWSSTKSLHEHACRGMALGTAQA